MRFSEQLRIICHSEEPFGTVIGPLFFHLHFCCAARVWFKGDCDLVFVIGSSLKVSPVARIPDMIPANVPQILINREPLPHIDFNCELLGNCDAILYEIATRMGWSIGYTPPDRPTDSEAALTAPAADAGPADNSSAAEATASHSTSMAVDVGGSLTTAVQPGHSVDRLDSAHGASVGPDGGSSAAFDGRNESAKPMDSCLEDGQHSSEPEPIQGRTCALHFHAPKRFVFEGAVLEFAYSDQESDPGDDADAESAHSSTGSPAANGSCRASPALDATCILLP